MHISFGRSREGLVHSGVNSPDHPRRTRHCAGTYQLYQPATGRSWWLKEGENSVGRCRDNDVILSDDSVSRHHARIVVEGSHVFVEDLKSSNGTKVAGQKVRCAPLMRDVSVTFGRIEVILRKPSTLETGDYTWADVRD